MKKLKIELIHPPHPEAMEDRLDVPLGLLYIAASLIRHGYDPVVNDLSGKKESEWEINPADIYGITVYIPTLEITRRILSTCRKVNPKAKIIAGGACASASPEILLNYGFDAVVIGEGEKAILRVARDYPDLKYLMYKDPLDKDLDKYPWAAWDLIDLKSYKRTIDGEKSVSMVTSRGCPYRCAFCGLADHHRIVKFRSPEDVAAEILYLKEKKGIQAFNFQDDIFTMDRKRLYRLLELIELLNIIFRCHGRAGMDTKEDYKRLKEAGCVQISWGTESGSQEMLNRMNKRVLVEQNEQVIKWAKELGINSRAFFVFGFPGETKETMEETKAFITRADPDQYFISNFIPYPKTDVALYPEKYGITYISKDYKNYFQINARGVGGITFETKWLSIGQFAALERDFRQWVAAARQRRGALQEYEEKLEGRTGKL